MPGSWMSIRMRSGLSARASLSVPLRSIRRLANSSYIASERLTRRVTEMTYLKDTHALEHVRRQEAQRVQQIAEKERQLAAKEEELEILDRMATSQPAYQTKTVATIEMPDDHVQVDELPEPAGVHGAGHRGVADDGDRGRGGRADEARQRLGDQHLADHLPAALREVAMIDKLATVGADALSAQEGATITGVVRSEAGAPLGAVTVFLTELSLGTQTRGGTVRNVVLPMMFPALVAGSIFTFSLTLGDYITPQIVMAGNQFIGNVVYTNVGVANNLPLASAFATVPIAVMIVYLLLARRAGAFDSL